ncbi:hypothetical protein DTO217A2_5184 [Paecilomyces variotii]|nr:hypothetical protein DTO217A2_5184 [Paecilomyces variotii]
MIASYQIEGAASEYGRRASRVVRKIHVALCKDEIGRIWDDADLVNSSSCRTLPAPSPALNTCEDLTPQPHRTLYVGACLQADLLSEFSHAFQLHPRR